MMQSVTGTDNSDLDLDLIRSSYSIIESHSEEFAESFYQVLFEKYPNAKPFFSEIDIKQQELNLIKILDLALANIHDLKTFSSILKNLGKRHVKYGLILRDYPLVENALLQVLEKYLGEDWNLTAKHSWSLVYQTIADGMAEGANSEIKNGSKVNKTNDNNSQNRQDSKSNNSSEIEKLNQFERARLPNGSANIDALKFPGSEGEHLLQAKYQTRDRAVRFYTKQVFDELNKNMQTFLHQTDLCFITTWGRSGLGYNIQLNEYDSYIINSNKIIIRVNSYHTLRNIEVNPHITLYYVNFIDKQVGLHINGKVSILSGMEIVKSSQYPDRDLYGIPSDNIPLELISRASTDVDAYWFLVTTEECYIHCSKHILAHQEIEKKLLSSGTSELSTLELVEQNILKAEMFVIATADRHGETDCSLRAGPPGFIEIHQGKIRYPEYRGNGVLASLGNITENPEVALSIFNFCSINEKTILIKGIAKILEEDVSSSTDNIAKRAIEHWIEIDPIEIQVRQEKSRPLYQKIEGRKVPWGTDDDKTKKTGYFITATDP